MGKHNAKSKGQTAHTEIFAKMLLGTMCMPAWRALSSTEQALYVWVKLEWRGPQANNNGKIRLSTRQACDRMGIRKPDTIANAFHGLQAKGFLVVTERAILGVEGEARGPAYEVTELALPGREDDGRPHAPRKLFKAWKQGNDFPVARSNANNPTGRNGKKIPVLKNGTDLSRKSGRTVNSYPENRDGLSRKSGRTGSKSLVSYPENRDILNLPCGREQPTSAQPSKASARSGYNVSLPKQID